MQRDQFVAPDFSQYPDYDDYERPERVQRVEPPRPEQPRPEQPRPEPVRLSRARPWYEDRFMMILLFLVVVCLYNMVVVSRLESEIAVLNRVRG